jgi:hypothetical protein
MWSQNFYHSSWEPDMTDESTKRPELAQPVEGVPTQEVKLKGNLALTSLCTPPSYWHLQTRAENISITNVSFTNLNPLWPYCSYIPKDEVIRAGSEAITKTCAAEYTQHCSGCGEYRLADFNKTRGMRGHATVYVKRDGSIVDKEQAECQIDFDYNYDLVIVGDVGLCFPPNLRPQRN